MAATLADAYVRLRPETREFGADTKKEIEAPAKEAGDHAGKSFGGAFTSAVRLAVVGAAAVTGLAIKGLTQAVNKASDLAETQSKVNVVFGKGAPAIQAWAKNAATALGQTNQVALDGASTFALYGKAAGKTGQDLVTFSTKMATLASDVGSFSNVDPAQVIEDFGAAMRGEFDPVEKYGILLNDATVKNEALKLGIIKTTKDALTPQQRVLAVQSALFRQTKDAQGDFARTSGGLANQQRILAANTENLTASIGVSLLPVVTQFVTLLNAKVIPNLQEIWRVHGPQISAWLLTASTRFADFLASVDPGDVTKFFGDVREAVERLAPALADLKEQSGSGLSDTWRVTGVVMGFLADHADTLADALPYLAAGFIILKAATIASNVAQAASPFITLAAAAANRRLAASNVELTAAINAQKVSQVTGTVVTEANTVAENTSMLTKIRSTAATVASRVAMVAGTVATGIATAATWAFGAAMAFVTSPIGIVILVIAALAAGIIYAYKHSETFRDIVQGAWKGIQIAVKFAWDSILKPTFDAFVWLLTNVLGPSVMWLWNTVIKPTWNFISGHIRDTWNNVIKPIFSFLVKYITEDIPNGFRNGVTLVGLMWDRVKDIAKVPIRFVIETVINDGIIGVFNKVADFLHLPGSIRIPKVPLPAGFAGGGRIPGSPSDVDNTFGRGPNGGLIALATGEYIVNSRSTQKALPILEWINSGMPGFAGGGLFDFFTGPIDWVKDKVSSPIRAIAEKFGENRFAQVGIGVANMAKDGLITRVQDLLGSSDVGGGGGSTSGLQPAILGVLAALRALFGNVPVISGFRKNSTTLTGNRSYHADGRAFDIAPRLMWAQFLNAAFGTRLRELITPWNDLNIHNGQPHRYSGAVWNQHNFAGGNAHIHAAMRQGGRIFDRGGAWPTNTVGVNLSGRTEQVLNGDTTDRMVDLLMAILSAIRGLASEIGAEIDDAGAPLRRMSRAGALAWPS